MRAPAGRLSAFRTHWRRLTSPPAMDGATVADGAEIMLDEATLARLRRLSLVAGRARTEGLAGEHRSKRRGTSPEFADFKPYSPGDDFRRIDWNTYARLGGLFVRLSEVTTELSVHILLDSSASMDWRGEESRPIKFTAARRLTAALAYVALWGFDRVTIVPFADELGVPFGPVQGRGQTVPAIRHLEGLQPMGGTALAPVIAHYGRARSRPGLLLLVTDLLSGEPAELELALHDLRARGWQTAVLHIVDEAEIEPGSVAAWLRGNDDGTVADSVELIDRESGAVLRLAADDDVIERYVRSVLAWMAALEGACEREATAYARVSTSWDFDDLTLALLHERGVVA